ncbi:hypothetical protein QLQ12_28415 [Actinoplanes sp. NEAU-A12]|uniref:Uncharacterized protein n=1 Tax=Actinoplanes sandaracinus TaxID=3045177 RepID=A0ABT6WS28_9ACTN|nr:hypothetical protein [Actinoplanes sandaracinus]MDI6102551.1 hypothetical protein [Actinoplanes sandaracinus]
MTDENLDQRIRNADIYRPGIIGDLDGPAQSLLEEIMSEPTLKSVAEAPGRRSRTRRGILGGLVGTGVAASVLAGAVAVSALKNDSVDVQAAPVPGSSATEQAYPAMVLKAAEANPRLLIDEPGWKATTVYGFAKDEGTIAFTKGELQLEMNWYPAKHYAGFRKDRLEVSKPEPVKVAGATGDLITYSGTDFAALLPPRESSYVELRTGGKWTRAEFDRILDRIIRADVRTWLAALPADIVTPEKVQDQAAKVLADIPLPPGFDKSALDGLGTNERYHFGAEVTSLVGCGWITEWNRAKKAGDAAAVKKATDALLSSRNWKILKEMEAEGDWPEVFWETAEGVTKGKNVGYEDAIGCK